MTCAQLWMEAAREGLSDYQKVSVPIRRLNLIICLHSHAFILVYLTLQMRKDENFQKFNEMLIGVCPPSPQIGSW